MIFLNYKSRYSKNQGTPINLFDLSESSKFNASKIYVEGVSFVDYEENVILPSKYLFILGLSSNQFPKKKNISEIDLRNELVDNYSSWLTGVNFVVNVESVPL